MFGSGQAGTLLNSLAQKAKAFAAGVSEIELKVLEATNEDKWGPHGNDMKEIARAAEDPSNRALIMEVIWQRLRETDENWRLCYKGMLLCEFLIKQGPMRCVDELSRSAYVFERLRDNFQYKDADGRDQGVNVRERARNLATLLSSSARIKEEREKARANANKYTGVSASDMRGGGGSYGGYGGSGGGSYGSGGSGSGYGNGSPQQHHQHTYSGGGNSSHSAGHSRSTSSTAAGGGGGGGSSSAQHRSQSAARSGTGAANEEDPFEATRKRIERLKAQEAAGEGSSTADNHVPVGSINMDASTNLFPESKPRMGPKKLSEVKVDPAITATFGAGLAPPPAAGSVVRGSASRLAAPPSHASTSSAGTLDLFGGLDAAPSPQPPAATRPASAIDWDTLSFPSTSEPSSTLAASQPPVQRQQPPAQPALDLFADMPAAKQQPPQQPAVDLFAEMPAAKQRPPQQPALDLFAEMPVAQAAPPPVSVPAAAPLDLFGFDSPLGGTGPASSTSFAPAFTAAPPPVSVPAAPLASISSAAFADPFGFGVGGNGPALAPAAARPQAPQPMSDPFGMGSAPAPAGFSDPFAAFPAPTPAVPTASVRLAAPTAAAPPKAPAKATDPFADLFA